MALNKYGSSSSPIDTKPLPRPSDLIRKFDAVEIATRKARDDASKKKAKDDTDAKTSRTAPHIIPKNNYAFHQDRAQI